MQVFEELKRRNVIRVGAAYLVTSWLLIQIAETIFPLFGFSDRPARIVVILLAIGFLPAMVMAWVFEFTSEGLKREKYLDHAQSTPALSSKKLDRLIMVVLIAALSYFSIDKFVFSPERDAALKQQQTNELARVAQEARQEGRSEAIVESFGEQSIAVLAFEDMSPDKDQEYLSDGIAEELLNLLAAIPELRVISRSSAFSYKHKDINLALVAKELSVAHILEGSVRKAGDQVRITAQLIDARSDTHLWSKTYDRTLDDVFAVQDEIAESVVEALKLELFKAIPKPRGIDPQALDLNLRASYFWHRRGEGDMQRTRQYYEESVAIDSDNAPAWAGLAVIYREMARAGLMDEEEGKQLSRQAAFNAVEADPNYAEGHIRLAWAYWLEGNKAAWREHRAIASSLNPNSPLVIFDNAVEEMNEGRLDQAIVSFERLASMNPLSAIDQTNLASFYMSLGQLDKAEIAVNKAIELSPAGSGTRINQGVLWVLQKRFQEVLKLLPELEEDNEKFLLESLVQFSLGNFSASQSAYEKLSSQGELPPQAWQIKVHAWRNELDEAFAMMQMGVDLEIGFTTFLYDPLLKNMHSDQRWEALLIQAGWQPPGPSEQGPDQPSTG